MTSPAGPGNRLPERFQRHVSKGGLLSEDASVLVALSGGLDSVVLLHILRFHPPVSGLRLTAAHFDHGMRPGSPGDAAWSRGLARAWEVPFREGTVEGPAPGDEAAARRLRYSFLRSVAGEVAAAHLLTAHHADDQAETVLFRMARGTGPTGLSGIPERGSGGLLRPLLPFWRSDLEAYARRARLAWREDPTNVDQGFARNSIRHDILPRLEVRVAPGARRSLVRLARLARRDEQAWESLLPKLLEGVVEEASEVRIVLARPAFLAYDPGVRARLLRALVRRFGPVLDETGTRAALEFTSRGASGRRHTLPGGAVLTREFDRFVLEARGPVDGDPDEDAGSVEIPGPGEGEGILRLRGRAFHVRWSPGNRVEGEWVVERFGMRRLSFPLRLRGWISGDRIRLAYGTKKLKKLFSEMRIPRSERMHRPVLVDGREHVLWVPGVARAAEERSADGGENLTIGIMDAHDV